MMSEIKRCPFCGGEIKPDGHIEYICETCDLWVISLEWWNTRPIEDTLRAERDELMEILKEFKKELAEILWCYYERKNSRVTELVGGYLPIIVFNIESLLNRIGETK